MHFLDNFDPETSARERRKLNRKCYFSKIGSPWFNPCHSESGGCREGLKQEIWQRNRSIIIILNKCRKTKTVYDEVGKIAATGRDLCDCLDLNCPGCHFPCPKCYSNKCGNECRVNRKWMYEKIEIEGSDLVIKNKYKTNEM